MALGLRVLEERVLFDAAPVEEVPEGQLRELAAESAGEPTAPGGEEIVFIDGHLSDAQGLASAALPGAEVHVLDPGADGLHQILDILSGRSGVSAVHVLSHGSAGAVEIGSAVLDSSTLDARAEDLALLGRALSQDGDLLLYGCQVGANGEGARFADSLASLTGADVAVSTDDTGGRALGGDWELEYTSGPIEAGLPASLEALEAHNGLLLLTREGSEFLVNSTTASIQIDSSLGIDAAGNFVISWSDQGGATPDIRARRFDSAGNPLGLDFVVNSTTPSNQRDPSVAHDGAGNFVIAWSSVEGLTYDIRARRFDSAGNPLGADFVVNTTTANAQRDPSVAHDGAGNFVIAWRSNEGGAAFYDIRARRFDSAGNPLGADFLVNNTTPNDQRDVSASVDGPGNFVVIWTSDEGGASYDIRARRFDSAGNALGLDFVVNSTTPGNQRFTSVARDGAGNFVIAWSSQEAAGYDIRARRFDSAGNALGPDFVANSTTPGTQNVPYVARDGSGNFVIAWESSEVGVDIRAREFDPTGTPIGLDFLVNATTASEQIRPSTAFSNQGNVVVTWSSTHPGNYDIFGQRFSFAPPGAPSAPVATAPAPATLPSIDPVTVLDILGARTQHLQPGTPTDPGFPSWDFRLELARSPGADLSDLDPDFSTLLRELFAPAFLRKRRMAFPGLQGA
ncbi:MAG: DUF4347 domain-containing protein [Planctomycetes bacterium]|nr:DUF4347 domain-containing protein [Planctomycetota bacterium]